MKMLIDLPEKADYDQILMALNGGLRLPDNATNGEVFKAIYPLEFLFNNCRSFENHGILIGNYIRFDEKWWDERYTQLD